MDSEKGRRAKTRDSGSTTYDALSIDGRVHIIGAGPVGLLLTALLQPMDGFSVRLYEKRPEYTRTRMVKLASYLVADSVESYREDAMDADNIEAIFNRKELEERVAFRQAIPADLGALLVEWEQGFLPLNSIERALSNLIDARESKSVERVSRTVTAEEAMAMLEPGDMLFDCSGSKSLLRDRLTVADGAVEPEANTLNVRLEYAIVVTFLYGQAYDCNEFCKYDKNVENVHYKFIPAVSRTCFDGSISHVTGIVNISAEVFAAMPPKFDGAWLRSNFPDIALSMDRFIAKVKEETHGEVIGDLEIIRIPLNLYRARHATNRMLLDGGHSDNPLARTPVVLAGDSAMGSPYFQSISLGFESAMFLAGHLAQRDLPLNELLERYEMYHYKQWLRVYIRSKMIKHNKDLFEVIDDKLALLSMLHLY